MSELEKILIEQNKDLRKQLELMNEQLRLLTQQLYGRSSEASKKAADENQLSLFDEEDVAVKVEADEQPMEKITYQRRMKKTLRAELTKDLETETVICTLEGEECQCDWCSSPLRPIGKSYVRTEVEFIPARLKKIEYYTTSYECPACKSDGADAIHKAPTPRPVIQKSLASPSAVSWLLHQKYEMSLPFHRQEKEWAAYGLPISRATMANWTIRAAQQWLAPIYQSLQEHLILRTHLHADETTTQVLQEEDRKATATSYMWLFQTVRSDEKQAILYHYAPTRSGDVPNEFLSGFNGYLHCDGYDGYNKVVGGKRVGCWAHVRRKFVEARVSSAGGKKTHSEVGLDYCNRMFKLERDWKELTPLARHERRLEEMAPLLTEFWKWVEAIPVLPSTKLGKALAYMTNQKPYLMNFMEDGACELSNNEAERSIRPFVVGRKNWYFSNSVRGAETSAISYSLIETAKANGLNPQKYLAYLFKHLPNVPFKNKTERLEAYLPWSPEIQTNCK